ncbi:DNA topoisomerase 3 [Intestinimonas butyriciproducens]|uniref:DNA topoisomerase 3 n=1 Tax=Intestinimonas butyriciproducens TaxID=1297617 RepID=UPI00189AB97C|nr:DNA topoisomerase 3 [Intestinimonas butyriciproducens]MDB7831614.1 DNA topoisomerase 3 [Intestinimonas butyriciproducens]
MSYQLVIAEKPSVARSIAGVIGANERHDGYLQGNGYLVSWCIGHLVSLADAGQYDERLKKWRYEDLPILPQEWQYIIPDDKKKQFDVLRCLMERPDVDGLVCATDAGREGELIFRFVYQMAGCKKPFQRLWISSMEDAAIREGFQHLKPGADYDALYQSALCRARADWLVGINATRLFSILYHKTLTVGRVQTPTLKMLVDREAKISGFQKEKYHIVQLAAGGVEAASGHISDAAEAEKVRAACAGAQAVCASVKREKKTEQPPRLYDLTTLQREANRLFGFTAKQTLDYAQQLYEKKLLTYPRTDSQYLTDDMQPTAESIVSGLWGLLPFAAGLDVAPQFSRVLNSKKVSDHHAIIPTMEFVRKGFDALAEGEKKLLSLVCCKLLCAVAGPHEYEAVTATFTCAGQEFTAKGKTVLSPGWKEIDRRFKASFKTDADEDAPELAREWPDGDCLPELSEGQTFENVEASVSERFTAPPKAYTEDTLLSAMERAGAEDMPEDAERQGLGTPATRASILEKLVHMGFVQRKGKQLIPTKDGHNLACVLPDALTSPQLTAEWETKLAAIARGEADPEGFMRGIEEMTRGLICQYSQISEDAQKLFQAERVSIGTCPRCGGAVYEGKKNYYCGNRSCQFVMWKNDKFFEERKKPFTPKIAAALLKSGKAKVKGLYSVKTGKTYDGTVLLADTGGKYVNYRIERRDKN